MVLSLPKFLLDVHLEHLIQVSLVLLDRAASHFHTKGQLVVFNDLFFGLLFEVLSMEHEGTEVVLEIYIEIIDQSLDSPPDEQVGV